MTQPDIQAELKMICDAILTEGATAQLRSYFDAHDEFAEAENPENEERFDEQRQLLEDFADSMGNLHSGDTILGHLCDINKLLWAMGVVRNDSVNSRLEDEVYWHYDRLRELVAEITH